jgi:hypothetical protein
MMSCTPPSSVGTHAALCDGRPASVPTAPPACQKKIVTFDTDRNEALQDLGCGNGFALIDPQGDLVARIAARIPAAQRDRVI